MTVVIENSAANRTATSEHAADMQLLIDSLPARSGESRAAAAYYLMEDRTLSAAQLAMVRPVAIQEFPHMEEIEQQMLLDTAWPAIRDPSLAPALRVMLDRSPNDQYALPHLLELDPDGARPYAVRAICNPKAIMPLDALAALPDAALPGVDACLAAALNTPPAKPADTFAWKTRAQLAARFATSAILPALRQGWKTPEQDSSALAVLLRFEPAEAVARIDASKSKGLFLFFELNNVYKARHAPFPAELSAWLRREVENGSPGEAVTAAIELAQFGATDDRIVLEERLARLRAETASPSPEAVRLEGELMSDLRSSPLWHLDDAAIVRLADGCLGAPCRLYGKVTPNNASTGHKN